MNTASVCTTDSIWTSEPAAKIPAVHASTFTAVWLPWLHTHIMSLCEAVCSLFSQPSRLRHARFNPVTMDAVDVVTSGKQNGFVQSDMSLSLLHLQMI